MCFPYFQRSCNPQPFKSSCCYYYGCWCLCVYLLLDLASMLCLAKSLSTNCNEFISCTRQCYSWALPIRLKFAVIENLRLMSQPNYFRNFEYSVGILNHIQRDCRRTNYTVYIYIPIHTHSRSQWPRGLRHKLSYLLKYWDRGFFYTDNSTHTALQQMKCKISGVSAHWSWFLKASWYTIRTIESN
jgi:hypothetical protein